jgi:hypothetical protein
MQAPLLISNKELINLSNKNIELSSLGKTHYIQINKYQPIDIHRGTNGNTFSYASPSSTTFPSPIRPTYSSLQSRDIIGRRNVDIGKVNLVHSNISGIQLKLGGRLEKTTIVPRRSSQEILIGNMSRRSTSFKNTSSLTYKNKRGAYSITVSLSYFSNNK